MSNYTKLTNFAAKDALVSGNPAKVIKGAEVGAEFDAVAVSVNSKADSASPTFTGRLRLTTLLLQVLLRCLLSTAAHTNDADRG
jgi:hypothetical protein